MYIFYLFDGALNYSDTLPTNREIISKQFEINSKETTVF
jgi:hypothetical protein